ncbi:unnamed protein product [Spodoptera exigua]|nr:unnamed protein product [Spodoptera exigua]
MKPSETKSKKKDYEVFLVALLAAVASSEPPVGYNYQQPARHNSYNSPTNSYLPPTTDIDLACLFASCINHSLILTTKTRLVENAQAIESAYVMYPLYMKF